MLLSLQAGGVGLNLTGANHVFMIDMHWNPALEEQAADRCHRVGQIRDVFIHRCVPVYTLGAVFALPPPTCTAVCIDFVCRFVCQETVEEKILQLQEKKLQLSRNVLSG